VWLSLHPEIQLWRKLWRGGGFNYPHFSLIIPSFLKEKFHDSEENLILLKECVAPATRKIAGEELINLIRFKSSLGFPI
jgi:hypothetical protein